MTPESNSALKTLSFRKARPEDAEQITRLVNAAYRGDSSKRAWTSEVRLMDGNRTNEAEVRQLIETEGSIILLGIDGADIVGSLHLKRTEVAAYFGLFVVNPELQGAGIGKHLLQFAESFVQREWGVTKMWMTVITRREELVAFYERRGYRRTGQVEPFPENVSSIPLVQGLLLEVLEKDLTATSLP